MALIPPHIAKAKTTEPLVQESKGYVSLTSHELPKARAVVNAKLVENTDGKCYLPVAVAPITHGRSFNLRWSYGPRFAVGQMLVLLNREHYGAPMEVVETFFPECKKTVGRNRDRFYLGDRKLGKEFSVGIIEIKKLPSGVLEYRLLFPSGKYIHDWKPLDLTKLRIKTTEEQRANITAFTGIIYKVQERKMSKIVHKHAAAKINHVIDADTAKLLESRIIGAS